MKSIFVSLVHRSLLAIALSGAFMSASVQADSTVVAWVEKPDFSSFRIIRSSIALPDGQADLQACDIVQLKNNLATVRITLSNYQRLQLDAKVPGRQIQVPCDEKLNWYGKPMALLRAISGLATAPATATRT